MIRSFQSKLFPVYCLLLLYLILNLTFFTSFSGNGLLIIKLSFWILLSIYIYIIVGKKKSFARKKVDKLQVILIILILYYMIYFATGLFFGYEYSPYSRKLFSIITNILMFVPIVILQEYVRYILVQYSGRKLKWYIVIIVLFTCLSLNFESLLLDFSTYDGAFKYTCSILLPTIFKNILLTYLGVVAGFKSMALYQSVIQLCTILLPIFPKLDWFFTGVFELLLPTIVYINVHYIDLHDERKISRVELKRNNPLHTIPVFFLCLLLVAFVAGFLKFQPIAVVSNSMVPTFLRGDAVVIEKISAKEKASLRKGDIIQFESDNKLVIHRIYDIQKNGTEEIAYVTKGDNNNAPDSQKVNVNQIRGKYVFHIPKLGYPSVWLYELFQKN